MPVCHRHGKGPVDCIMRIIMLAAIVYGCLVTTAAQAQETRIRLGYTFAQSQCGSCHAVGVVGESPLQIAPPFRSLHKRYPVEYLAEALAEGIVTGHPAMPRFELDVVQIGDLIAYLKSLEP